MNSSFTTSMSAPPPAPAFDESPILSYLGLPESGCEPSPRTAPIDFLIKHLQQLPPHLLLTFSSIINPKQRTPISTIRNRRLKYANLHPPELSFSLARRTWPTMWEGRERRGQEEGQDEKEWAESGFLRGSTKHVGKLGSLLGGYEEEREAERVRILRRERAVQDEFVLEEEEESDSSDEIHAATEEVEQETVEEAKASFERLVRERFIYGLLEASVLLW